MPRKEKIIELSRARPSEGQAIIRHHKKDNRIVVLCGRGHFLDSQETGPGKGYAGSRFEAELGQWTHGLPNVFDRRAEQCTGPGH